MFNFAGYFLLAEASGRYPGDKARVESARINNPTDHCLRFYYYMYGNQVDNLKVSVCTSVCLSAYLSLVVHSCFTQANLFILNMESSEIFLFLIIWNLHIE